MSRGSSIFFANLSYSKLTSRQTSISHSPTIYSPSQTIHTSTRSSRRTSSESLNFLTSTELKAKAVAALTSLYDASEHVDSLLISPDVTIEHDAIHDEPLSLTSWSESIQSMPNLEIDVLEAIADASQSKVRVRSSVTGLPNGRRKESIDVMSFDSEGVLVSLAGEWRSITSRDAEEYEAELSELEE